MSRFVSVAGEQVAGLADRCADAGRLSRGRTLFRKGSVSDLSVIEGSVIASVRGSEGAEYETTVGTALAPPGVIRQIAETYDPENRRSVDDLIGDGIDVCPRETDLAFACDCADWDEPCKHVVAVLLALADRVDLDQAELFRWRGIDLSASSSTDAKREVPSRSPSRSSVEDPDERRARLSELEALLGDTAVRLPTDGRSDSELPTPTRQPALAEFLGVGRTLDPVDVSGVAAPAPLFAEVQLGPLAELGPELAKAMATIIAELEAD